MSAPDICEFQPSLVLFLWDGFTGSNALAGDVIVRIGQTCPLFQDAHAEFVFGTLANGSYMVNVESVAGEPYYLPVNIPVTIPFPRPADSLWNERPVWPGYPDIVLSDPTKMLGDPDQTPAYLGQRATATLSPAVTYPFPASATLARGVVTAKGLPLSGALVTTALVAQPGQFSVVVVDPSGSRSAAQTLTVVAAPVITSIDPATVTTGTGSFTLTAEGSGFVSGTVLKWNGAALPTTLVSSGGLTAQVTAAQVASTAQVTLIAVNPDGTASNQRTLTVAAAPVIVSIDPQDVTAGSPAFTLVVRGSGFVRAAAVELNGNALATTWMSSTQLTAQVTAAQVANPAQNSIVVMNIGTQRQPSNSEFMSVVSTPVIGSLEPSTVVAGGQDFSLTITGSGFTGGMTAKLAGAALPTEVRGATELTAQVTAAQVASTGQFPITVSNPGGSTSNAQPLTVTAASAIASLVPSTVTAGVAAFAVSVLGSGFVLGSVVELNGTALSTTFVNSTELHAHVPRNGYTTGQDGAFVLYFDSVTGHSQSVSLVASHPGFPNLKSVDVTVLRGATVPVNIDMSS